VVDFKDTGVRMSLIHDALKKAQAPSADEGKKEFPQFLQDNPQEEGKSISKKRTLVLAILLVISLFFLVYQKFFAGKPQAITAAQNAAKSSGKMLEDSKTKQAEVIRLKEEAFKSFKKDNFEDAWIRLSTASQLDPQDSQIWNNMGLVSKRKGDVAKAREFFEKSLQLKPECPECLNNLAVLDIDEGNLKQAQGRLTKALSLNPQYADATFHLALTQEQQGDISKAVIFYKKYLELATDASPQLVDQVRRHILDLGSE